MTEGYNKPDLAAPRYRTPRLPILNRELYDKFIKKFPEHEGLSPEDFKLIVRTFNESLWQAAINNRDGIELPESLGYIFIGTCPRPRKKNLDPKTSMTYNTKVTHRNFESDGYLAKIFYTNFASKYRFKDREVWKFKGYRDFSRGVAKTYPEKWKMYVQVDNFQRISKLYGKHKKKDYAISCIKPITDAYNEFEMD